MAHPALQPGAVAVVTGGASGIRLTAAKRLATMWLRVCIADSLERGGFYILCPDNDVPRSLDKRRILWAAGDLVDNRPPLSRWHPDHGEAFKAFAASGSGKE